jgi:hypothetical protein
LSVVRRELAYGMSLALESSASDIDRALAIVQRMDGPQMTRRMAESLLERAHRRVEQVRTALGEAGTGATEP